MAYQEFPKHVIVAGRVIVCLNEDEEAEAVANGQVKREPEECARLMKIVEVKKVPNVDGRWKMERIVDAIRNAGHDPELDPTK